GRRRRLRAPVVELGLEPFIGALRPSHFSPVIGVAAASQAEMHVDEVENFVEPVRHDAVEAKRERRVIVAAREVLGEHYRCEVADVKAGRFQRFDKVGGKPDGDAVAYPRLLAMPDLETHDARIERRRMAALETPDLPFGVLLADKGTGVHIPERALVL